MGTRATPQPPQSYATYVVAPQPAPRRRWIDGLATFLESQVSFIVSAAIHTLILLLLALVATTAGHGVSSMQLAMTSEADSEELQLAEGEQPVSLETSEDLADLELQSERPVSSFLSEVMPSSSLELVQPEEANPAPATNSVDNESESAGVERGAVPAHTGMMTGRSGERRQLLLKQYGGTDATEAAVRLGIEWLMRQQAEDGSWSFSGPYAGAARFDDNPEAATSMALLAILGAGHTHKSGEYRKQVEMGLKWLVRRQLKSGQFGSDTPRHHSMYTHAQATLALCEAYTMTSDSWLRAYCEKAVAFAVASQGTKGGWRYEPRGDSDTSVTGWFLIALVSAKSGGFEVPDSCLRRVTGWLNKVDRDDGATYGYMESRVSSPAMTAEGLLCRMYLGWEHSRPALDKGIKSLLKTAPFQDANNDFYYWYYATQVMHHFGGKPWKDWNGVMREQLPMLQEKQPPEVGSWGPRAGRFDQVGGRLYCTCMALYCLEVYYRHLPIYDSPWKN